MKLKSSITPFTKAVRITVFHSRPPLNRLQISRIMPDKLILVATGKRLKRSFSFLRSIENCKIAKFVPKQIICRMISCLYYLSLHCFSIENNLCTIMVKIIQNARFVLFACNSLVFFRIMSIR